MARRMSSHTKVHTSLQSARPRPTLTYPTLARLAPNLKNLNVQFSTCPTLTLHLRTAHLAGWFFQSPTTTYPILTLYFTLRTQPNLFFPSPTTTCTRPRYFFSSPTATYPILTLYFASCTLLRFFFFQLPPTLCLPCTCIPRIQLNFFLSPTTVYPILTLHFATCTQPRHFFFLKYNYYLPYNYIVLFT